MRSSTEPGSWFEPGRRELPSQLSGVPTRPKPALGGGNKDKKITFIHF